MKLKINGADVECAGGSRYIDVLNDAGAASGALGVCVKGVTYSLCAEAEGGADARVLTYQDEEGRRIFERTAQFVLLAAAKRALGGVRIRIEHSMGHGVYAYSPEKPLSEDDVSKIYTQMKLITSADMPISRHDGTKAEAVEYFRETGQTDKLRLMRYRYFETFRFYILDGMYEYFYGEMAPSAGYVSAISLVHYNSGMVLMLPDKRDPSRAADFVDMPKIAGTFGKTADWIRVLGCTNAADLNEFIEKKRLREFIRVNEALQERGIQKIADQFLESGARVALIAGPSSSGKTTFAHRLLIALKALGCRPLKISLDDYYIDRELVPLEPDGSRDFERIDILDLDKLNENLLALLAGERTSAPEFDFVTGKPIPNAREIRIEDGQPIIIEGIHGLNDALTRQVPRDMKFKIYVSALTTLNIDDHNRIRTTDARLLRRIVRDYLFRGTAPETTMALWPSVRRGEEKYIFPYQEQADAMFNTSLAYELPIMKKHVYPILRAIQPEDEHYTMARRLVKFLNYFRASDVEDEIPVNSILREFIGGSCFYRDED